MKKVLFKELDKYAQAAAIHYIIQNGYDPFEDEFNYDDDHDFFVDEEFKILEVHEKDCTNKPELN